MPGVGWEARTATRCFASFEVSRLSTHFSTRATRDLTRPPVALSEVGSFPLVDTRCRGGRLHCKCSHRLSDRLQESDNWSNCWGFATHRGCVARRIFRAAWSCSVIFSGLAVTSMFPLSIYIARSTLHIVVPFSFAFVGRIAIISASWKQVQFWLATPRLFLLFPYPTSAFKFLRFRMIWCLGGFLARFDASRFHCSHHSCTSYCCYAHYRWAPHLIRKCFIFGRFQLKRQCSRAAG